MAEESWLMNVQGVDEQAAPKVFVSYSWDSEQHQTWVLQLAHRLRADGVDAVLDQWDTRLGSDLALFMESAANLEYRVLAIVTESYVAKSDIPQGGVGYERRVITPTLMNDLLGHRVVPVLRSGASLPIFMGANATKYIDFRDDDVYEESYVELLRDLHGMPVLEKPPLGFNPFIGSAAEDVDAAVRESRARYVSPAVTGEFEFDYENNDGRYLLGAGETEFVVRFGTAGHGSIHAYTDGTNLKSLALVRQASGPEGVGDASAYDGSSRVRTPQTGDAIVLRNAHDYWAAVFIDEVLTRHTSPSGCANLKARYVIQGARSRYFGPITSE
ncbi:MULTISPECIES: toll/interleukin-1 receptor domain-containing protein [Dietzia]|uniref:toll/interleukin-1 receptor domain-containing protein n=1 Tax=Dietzia TaxID=37914 RepID=UPI0029398197|nr:toll/interleukin-1 receptor domain-containing protein [Dietzia sp. IN118]MDV3357232.1 toll/interleukin-1 receptor domain-containing protein [Dietzia sp. IN118]